MEGLEMAMPLVLANLERQQFTRMLVYARRVNDYVIRPFSKVSRITRKLKSLEANAPGSTSHTQLTQGNQVVTDAAAWVWTVIQLSYLRFVFDADRNPKAKDAIDNTIQALSARHGSIPFDTFVSACPSLQLEPLNSAGKVIDEISLFVLRHDGDARRLAALWRMGEPVVSVDVLKAIENEFFISYRSFSWLPQPPDVVESVAKYVEIIMGLSHTGDYTADAGLVLFDALLKKPVTPVPSHYASQRGSFAINDWSAFYNWQSPTWSRTPHMKTYQPVQAKPTPLPLIQLDNQKPEFVVPKPTDYGK